MCLLDQPDNAREGARCGGSLGSQVEGIADICRPAHDRVPQCVADRHGFAGEGGFIEYRDAVGHRPIDGDHVTVPDEQPVPWNNRLQGHFLQPVAAMSHCRTRDTLEQGCHLLPCPALGEELEVLTSRIHQRDNRGSQCLPEGKGSAHRQCRNDVEPKIPPTQASDDLLDQRR